MLISPKRFGEIEQQQLAIVTWADGTDEEIAAMVQAADNGEINLVDYWSVGDERTVHLSAMTAGDGLIAQPEQDVVLVLMNEGYPGSGNEGVHFVCGQKDCLLQSGRMNTTNTTLGSWGGCAIRTDLNNKYYNALPATFKNCLKQFNVITSLTYDGSTNQTIHDYISLFAVKEIFGTREDSNYPEANALSQIEYYKTTSNRIKTKDEYTVHWWTRSPCYDDSDCFCAVYRDGSSDYFGAGGYTSISPFGCI